MHDRASRPATPAFPRAMPGNRVFAGISTAFPRSLMGPVMANGEAPASVIRELAAAFDKFKEGHHKEVQAIAAATDELTVKLAALQMNGPAGALAGRPADPAYTEKFSAFMRHGHGESEIQAMQREGQRAQIQASMSLGSASDGGYLAPVEFDGKINSSLRTITSMRAVAKIVTTGVQAYSTLWNARGWGSGWVGETAARPNTATGQLLPITFATGELYANPSTTQRLLDDASLDLAQWIADEVTEEFSAQEAIAFISGNGQNKPQGLLTYATDATLHPGGAATLVRSGAAAAVTADAFIDMVYTLPVGYRQNAKWLMSSTTVARMSKLKDGQGNYLWNKSYVLGQPDSILGFPVQIDENMPDVAAGALPVAFGDFGRGYVINDRQGVRVLRDPYTNKPYVSFYTTKRVGGGVLDIKAFTLMQVGVNP